MAEPRLVGPGRALVIALALANSGCILFARSVEYAPVRFEDDPQPEAATASPNWPVPPEVAERLIREPDYTVIELERTKGGTTGALEGLLRFEDDDATLRIKGKWVPGELDGFNNSPRKEIAAYAVQRLFLDPADYVVPTSAVVCRSNEKYRTIQEKDPSPQIEGANCMLLFLALWLENVTAPDVLYEQERFLTDATYARHLADLNLFAYLIDHRDKRKGNFLVSTDDDLRRAYSIDNGMAFDPFWYNYFVQHWNEIRVAALRRESVDRLRRWTRRDLEGLRVVQQFELKADGTVVESEPGPPLSELGFASQDGVVQFGLGAEEVDSLWARIQALLAEVDAGRIPLF